MKTVHKIATTPITIRPKYRNLHAPNHLRVFGTAILAFFMLTACGHDKPSDDVELMPVDTNIIAEQDAQQNAAEIEENIRNSYARLAAKRSDVCPKLLQKSVDDETIIRSAEVMLFDYCEYYVYPEVGQRIAITINTDKIETLLMTPSVHNFADGAYQVDSYGKHIIRLNYIGVKYKPERLQYDLTMKISN